MRRHELVRSPLTGLLSGLLLTACGGVPETSMDLSEEPLGTKQAAICAGLSVTQLSSLDSSSYGGVASAVGSWAVSLFSNAIHLDYYVDGVLRSSDERPGNSGTWYFSASGITCGTHAVQVKAYPMVIDSNNNETVCWDSPQTLSLEVTQDCPTASLSCTRVGSYANCTGSGTGGTGGYTLFWQYEEDTYSGVPSPSGWYQGSSTQSFYCPIKTMENPYNGELTIWFKVRDNSGMESSYASRTYLCAF